MMGGLRTQKPCKGTKMCKDAGVSVLQELLCAVSTWLFSFHWTLFPQAQHGHDCAISPQIIIWAIPSTPKSPSSLPIQQPTTHRPTT